MEKGCWEEGRKNSALRMARCVGGGTLTVSDTLTELSESSAGRQGTYTLAIVCHYEIILLGSFFNTVSGADTHLAPLSTSRLTSSWRSGCIVSHAH